MKTAITACVALIIILLLLWMYESANSDYEKRTQHIIDSLNARVDSILIAKETEVREIIAREETRIDSAIEHTRTDVMRHERIYRRAQEIRLIGTTKEKMDSILNANASAQDTTSIYCLPMRQMEAVTTDALRARILDSLVIDQRATIARMSAELEASAMGFEMLSGRFEEYRETSRQGIADLNRIWQGRYDEKPARIKIPLFGPSKPGKVIGGAAVISFLGGLIFAR